MELLELFVIFAFFAISQTLSLLWLSKRAQSTPEPQKSIPSNTEPRPENPRSTPVTPITQIIHPTPIREPKPHDVPSFSGNAKESQRFLNMLQLTFDLQKHTYNTDSVKVGFAISHLNGPAYKWIEPTLTNNDRTILDNFGNFVAAFKKTFGQPNGRKEAETAVLKLRQGNRSVAALSLQLRQYMASLSWTDETFYAAFLNALNSDIRLEVEKMKPEPETLDDLIQEATRLDWLLHPDRQDDSADTGYRFFPSSQRKVTQTSVSSSTGQSKVLDRERYMKEGLCFKCGQQGHISKNCPLGSDSTKQRIAATWTSPTSIPDSDPNQGNF
jgi:hypothetical protein